VGPHDTAWTFEGWVEYVFDRPVAAPEWWFGFAEELPVDPPPAEAVAFVTRLCERADVLLAPYSNAQVNQGLWYLVGSGASGLTLATRDAGVPARSWTDCVRAFGALFARLFAPRCSPHLGHLDEPGTDPLNSACYMWWDLVPLPALPDAPARAALDAACLAVMGETLRLAADACRESALHGLGHWQRHDPRRVAAIVDRFLADTPDLRPELRAYALAARSGCVL
jgi:hypothetical protein